MMLTGNADLDSSIKAVNEGHIFRFMTKPCSPDELSLAINAGIHQYKLVTAEKELLEKTLKGSVKVLTDVMSLASPAAFGKATRVRQIMKEIANKMKLPNGWEYELAGMLSQTGVVSLPTNMIDKIYKGVPLSTMEQKMFESHPKIGHDLIENIPRLENIAEIILYQEKNYDGTGAPGDEVQGDDIPEGARALKVALAYDGLLRHGKAKVEALRYLKEHPKMFDPLMISALEDAQEQPAKVSTHMISVHDLAADMILTKDVRGKDGTLLVSKGQTVTPTLMARLRNFARAGEAPEEVEAVVIESGSSGYMA
jgi:response regulator RpfG family c-di-GMP phosphodiesterase